jgi:hypothetical protein
MPPMRRRRIAHHFFSLCAALSLLLFVVVCVLWIRGLEGGDELTWRHVRWTPDGPAPEDVMPVPEHKLVRVTSDRRLWLAVQWGAPHPDDDGWLSVGNGCSRFHYYNGWFAESDDPLSQFDPDAGTFGLGPLRWSSVRIPAQAAPPYGRNSYLFGISHWVLALVLLVSPMLWLKRTRRAKRAQRIGLCPKCGYDLRAHRGGERCPECGTPAS